MTDLPTEPSKSPGSPPVCERQSGNRLTIAHLLLWMTTTALFMAITAPPLQLVQGYSDEQDASFQQQIRVLQYIIIAISPFAGAGVAAVVMAGWRRLQGGPPFPTQPGHWLLVLLGSGISVRLVFAIVERVNVDPSDAATLLLVSLGTAIVLMALVLAWAIKSTREPHRWRVTFQLLAVSLGGLFVTSCFGLVAAAGVILFVILYLLVPVAVLVSAANDIALRAKYDAFHWVGVVSGTSVALIIFAIPFIYLAVVGVF